MHACSPGGIQTCIHASSHTYVHTYTHALHMHVCIKAYMHTCIHSHTWEHAYIHTRVCRYKGAKTRMQFLPAYTYRHKYTVSRPQALNLLVGLGEARAARRRVAGSRIPKRTDLRKPGVNLMQEVACKSLALGFDLAFLGLTLLVDLRRH